MNDERDELLRRLREQYEALEREHKRLQQETPVDLPAHAAHAQKLKEHKQKLQQVAEALRNDEPPDVA